VNIDRAPASGRIIPIERAAHIVASLEDIEVKIDWRLRAATAAPRVHPHHPIPDIGKPVLGDELVVNQRVRREVDGNERLDVVVHIGLGLRRPGRSASVVNGAMLKVQEASRNCPEGTSEVGVAVTVPSVLMAIQAILFP